MSKQYSALFNMAPSDVNRLQEGVFMPEKNVSFASMKSISWFVYNASD